MHARRLTSILFGLTFVLLIVGGVVHSTGSSLACPDWPLCYGQVFPQMKGGILYEHSHRLLASSVGLLTVALCAIVWGRRDRNLRALGLAGVGLVIVQGVLGGLTVIYRLPALISIAHLGTSMVFFAWTMFMFFRLRAGAPGPTLVPRAGVALAAGLVYLQIVLGALVRHTGSSLACGLDVLTCAGAALPSNPLQWVQTTHRVGALVVMVAVIAATIGPMKAARQQGRPLVRRLGMLAHTLLLLQLGMGIVTIKTAVHMHVVTTHLALGALLWATMVAFFLSLGPLGASTQSGASSAAATGPTRELDGAC